MTASLDDLTSLELASELGVSVANVDQMRSRIRRVLRRHLDPRVAEARRNDDG